MISELEKADNRTIQVTFEWSPVVTDCPSFFYITTSVCGLCPNNTVSTTVTCTKALISQLCTFSVRTSVCDSLEGITTSISVLLDGNASMFLFQCYRR